MISKSRTGPANMDPRIDSLTNRDPNSKKRKDSGSFSYIERFGRQRSTWLLIGNEDKNTGIES